MKKKKTYGAGGDIASGAISGAMTGAAFGPWGIAGGALLGGTMGYLQNQNQPQQPQMPQYIPQSLGNPMLSFAGGGITDPPYPHYSKQLPTLYVDPNDPEGRRRYQVYNDSLNYFNWSINAYNTLMNDNYTYDENKIPITDSRVYTPYDKKKLSSEPLSYVKFVSPEKDHHHYIANFKQPHQPVEYQRPQINIKELQSRGVGNPIGISPEFQNINVMQPNNNYSSIQPIMRADNFGGKFSNKKGQYQVGERVFNQDEKRWVETRWDKDEIEQSRKIASGGQPNRKNLTRSSYASFAGGGDMSNELINLQGPSHEQGGINIGNNINVEGNETKLDNYIFSDRVKPKGSNKTYSQLSKDIENKYKMRKGDKLSEEAKERDFSKLRERQETDPAILKLREKTNKERYAGGGIMDPLTPKNPSLINNNYPSPFLQGGNPIDYSSMGTNNFIPMDGNIDYKQVFGPGTQQALSNQGLSGLTQGYSQNIPTANPRDFQQAAPQQTNDVQGLLRNLESMPSGDVNNPQLPQTGANNLNPYWIGALGNSIGPASQLVGSLINKADTTNFDRVKPSYLNTDQLRDSLTRQAGMGYNNMNRNVSANARTSGELMGNIVAGTSSINNNLMGQLANVEQNKYNTNTQIANNTRAQNAQIQMQEMISNEQNKAAYRNSVYGSMTDLGNIGAGAYKDYNMQKANDLQNQRLLNTLNSAGFNFQYDENGNMRFIPII